MARRLGGTSTASAGYTRDGAAPSAGPPNRLGASAGAPGSMMTVPTLIVRVVTAVRPSASARTDVEPTIPSAAVNTAPSNAPKLDASTVKVASAVTSVSPPAA